MSEYDDYENPYEPPVHAAEDPGSRGWLLASAGFAIVLSAATLAFGGLGWRIVGYALASLLAFTLVALFRRASVARFLVAGVGTPASTTAAAAGILIAGLAIAVTHAYSIARHFA